MANVSREQLALEIHARDVRLVIAVTGGGSGAIAALAGTPGASHSILAAAVPYAPQALAEWLGGTPDEYCSSWTARAMAMAAFLRAKQYDPAADTRGVACTASLASDRPKRGLHRAHLAWQSATTTAITSVDFEKGRRSRAEEEAITTDLVLNLIAEASGASGRLKAPLFESESLESARLVAPQMQQDLLSGRIDKLPINAAIQSARPLAVFSGAFRPLHDAHRKMALVAEEIIGAPVAYELSIANADKPPLDFMEIDARLRQFAADEAVWLSRAPVFTAKARLFPGATFIVGADTIARIGHERYYGSPSAFEAAMAEIAHQGCRFLVFGRTIDRQFQTLSDLDLSRALASLCQEVPESRFRDETSSTGVRKSRRDE